MTLLLGSLLGGLLTSCGTAENSRSLHVEGHLLVRSGHRWVASGVTDYLFPFYTSDGDQPDSSLASATAANFAARNRAFEAMRKDGVNVLRVPLGYLPSDPYHLGGMAGYVKRVKAVVSSAEKAGLEVDLSWWPVVTGNQDLQAETAAFPMMVAVHKALGADPQVFYEPYNEPSGISEAQWVTLIKAVLVEWREKIGYRGILAVDTDNYSSDFDPTGAAELQAVDRSLLKSPAQLVFANHLYPDGQKCFCGQALSEWESTVGDHLDHFPILGTEYGSYNSPYPANSQWTAQLAHYIESHAVARGDNGFMAFVWNWVDANTMTGSDLVTLNAYGQEIRRAFWSARSDWSDQGAVSP